MLDIILPAPSVIWLVVVVMDSGIENTKELSLLEPTHTRPACRVWVGVLPLVVILKETVASEVKDNNELDAEGNTLTPRNKDDH